MVIEPGNNINSQTTSSNKARQQPVADKVDSAPGQKPATPDAKDSVSLSSASLTISKIEAQLANISDVDAAKVEKIKAAVQSGNYQVNSEAIADKIQSEESSLGL